MKPIRYRYNPAHIVAYLWFDWTIMVDLKCRDITDVWCMLDVIDGLSNLAATSDPPECRCIQSMQGCPVHDQRPSASALGEERS